MKNILSKKQLNLIHDYCLEWDIEEYKINQDGSIDVNQDVDILYAGVTSLPFKFNTIHGNFSFTSSRIENLENMPNVVNGNFDISDNHLTSLEGCPRIIKGDFDFANNLVESTYVGEYDVIISGSINCKSNQFDQTFLHAIASLEEIEYDEEMDDTHDFLNEDGINEWDYNEDLIKIVFRYQRHYDIWNGNGISINDKNFQEFLDEIKDGLE